MQGGGEVEVRVVMKESVEEREAGTSSWVTKIMLRGKSRPLANLRLRHAMHGKSPPQPEPH